MFMQTPIPIPNPLSVSTYLTSSGRSWKRLLVALTLVVATLASIGTAPASAAPRVRVSGAGDLVISGTNADDTVSIWGDPPTQLVVRVQSNDSDVIYRFGNIARDIVINTRSGNDTIRLADFGVPRDLRINVSSGTNTLHVEDSSIGRDVRVVDGAGPAYLSFDDVDVHRNSQFTLGAGTHQMEFDSTSWTGSQRIATSSRGQLQVHMARTDIRGPFTLIGGSLGDRIEVLESSAFGHNVTFDLKGGHDILILDRFNTTASARLLRVKAGSGEDGVYLRNGGLNGSFNIDLGAGNDRGGMLNMDLGNPGLVNGGPGQDRYPMEAVTGGPTTFRSIEIGIGTIEL